MKRLLAYAQLVRLPNAFTAMADIGVGALALDALPAQVATFLCLLAASVALYCSGMVWNDFFDYEQDLRERPFRPLPSGRVSKRSAASLGAVLMALGVVLAALADIVSEAERWRALTIAGLLVAAIFLYDGLLKTTALGPAAMGTCRFLNILLGLCVAGMPLPAWSWLLALAVGTYITGVTWFARTEARGSNQNVLAMASGVMLLGVALGLAVPALAKYVSAKVAPAVGFPYLLVLFTVYVASAVLPAIARPLPQLVQPAVKRAVLGLVLFDAVLATGLAGWVGLVLIALLAPALWLGKWIYST
ncbi:MAG: UbiA family prenyltransferase [Gemmataceae bacterium]|nr:UbiA family prenyltransferase [Gemmataceae bacterium]